MKTKEEFHKLIDKITDEETLKGYFELIQKLNQHETGSLWKSLSIDEKKELIFSYEESLHSSNLISHEQVKKQHTKWLKE